MKFCSSCFSLFRVALLPPLPLPRLPFVFVQNRSAIALLFFFFLFLFYQSNCLHFIQIEDVKQGKRWKDIRPPHAAIDYFLIDKRKTGRALMIFPKVFAWTTKQHISTKNILFYWGGLKAFFLFFYFFKLVALLTQKLSQFLKIQSRQ